MSDSMSICTQMGQLKSAMSQLDMVFLCDHLSKYYPKPIATDSNFCLD